MISVGTVISAVCYLLLAPIIGGLLKGIARKLTALLQGRRGPSVLQAFYDELKLLGKESAKGEAYSSFVYLYLIMSIASGVVFFLGYNMLLVLFTLAIATAFLIMAAAMSNSARARRGIKGKMPITAVYMPMLFFAIVALYMLCGSFCSVDIITDKAMPVLPLAGIFVGLVIAVAAKLGASPFDDGLNTSATGGIFADLCAAFTCRHFAIVELGSWYQLVLMLGFLFLFFCKGIIWSYVLGALACIAIYLVIVIADNCFARISGLVVTKGAWAVTLVIAVANLFVLSVIM